MSTPYGDFMKGKSTYGLVEPFDCDDPMFALGVEWEQWRRKIVSGSAQTGLCLADNAVRIQNLLERHGYNAEARPFPFKAGKKVCRQWWQIWVASKPKCSSTGSGQ